MKKLLFVILTFLFVFSALNADYLIKQETKTDPIMGQPAKTELQELWVGDGVYANFQKKQITIINSKNNVMFVVYPSKKTFVEMKLPLDITKYMPAAMKGMIESTLKSMTVKVSANGKNEKVGNWNTKGYTAVMTMSTMGMQMKMNMDIAASTDVPFDWKKISAEFMGNMMMASGQMSSKVINEMKKIEGYIVKMTMTMNMMGMNIKVRTNVLSITKKDAPAGTYTVPAGYKKVDTLAAKGPGM